MPNQDIIDNRNEKLVDYINCELDSTKTARFAVGYFFLSGLEAISSRLSRVKELRLLIGNTTNRQTLEQLAEGYRRLELVKDAAEAESYRKREDARQMASQTAENIREAASLMDQTDEGEDLVRGLVRMIEEQRLKVRIYTRGRLHAKAYIFDYGTMYDDHGRALERGAVGVAIVGSSNLTLAGVTHNTELNVVVRGNTNHAQLVQWFDELWNEAEEFDDALMQEMRESWAVARVRPYDIYMKTLYALVRDRLEGADDQDILWDDEITKRLADFQKVAVRQAVQMIRDYGGAFVADVVGLGKSYIGAAVIKHFERIERARPLIICPATLVDMWERYNEVYELNARVLSMGFLREDDDDGFSNFLRQDVRFRDRDFILIDESHNFRHSDTQRYHVVQDFLKVGKRCCFLTATPRNKSAWDLYHQIKLFHPDDKTDLPVSPPDLREYFKQVEKGERQLQELLRHILIRRLRSHILRFYGYDGETHQPIDPGRWREYADGSRRAYVLVGGRHQFFPKRELETVEYSIEDAYQGLHRELRGYLGKAQRRQEPASRASELTYARYGLWHYLPADKQRREPYASLKRAGVNLRGLMRILLFKRFESSVEAFRCTVRKLVVVHERFLAALDEGIVPAGEEAQAILYEPNNEEERDIVEALREVSGRYPASDFDTKRLRSHIEQDLRLLRKILGLVEPITADKDAKLQTLLRRLNAKPLQNGKRLIFTQYADTARYLFENLNPDGRPDIDVIFSGDKSKTRMVGRFAPKANPEYRFDAGETEIMTLVATDVLAEGLNLQDCDSIINYDLHWNPVRLIQRFGRIDRIGSEHEVIYGFNFLPETGIEKQLGLREKLRNRIQEIHETIGEDSAILDRSEHLNEDAMYAIYEKDGRQLSLFEEEDEEQFLDINEAEEILRQLRKDDPQEFERIANLRDGIRTARQSNQNGVFVFCEAGRYQQLFLVDEDGQILSRDIPRVLATVKCGPDVKAEALPRDHNRAVMRVQRQFAEDVKHRDAERELTVSLSHGQRYVLRELRVLFGQTEDDELRGQINLLDKAFRAPATRVLNQELNRIRRNGIVGGHLLKLLSDLYLQHNLRDLVDRPSSLTQEKPIPRIVCSEALV